MQERLTVSKLSSMKTKLYVDLAIFVAFLVVGRFSLTFGLFGLSRNFIQVALIILLVVGLQKGVKAMSRSLRRPVAA
jgi:hypothetical protein